MAIVSAYAEKLTRLGLDLPLFFFAEKEYHGSNSRGTCNRINRRTQKHPAHKVFAKFRIHLLCVLSGLCAELRKILRLFCWGFLAKKKMQERAEADVQKHCFNLELPFEELKREIFPADGPSDLKLLQFFLMPCNAIANCLQKKPTNCVTIKNRKQRHRQQ